MSFRNLITKNQGIVIIIAFIIFVFVGKHFTDKLKKRDNNELFNSEFRGLIIKKYRQRGDIIIYRNLKNNIEGEIYATSELNKNSNIGDTIIKLPKSNLCIVKNKTELFNGPCYFIDFEE